ncbi:MAG: ATP-binding protein, partial [Blastocatellia bacterium]
SALLSSLILVIAAWVINKEFVQQARGQVQAEVETLLPLYDAVLNESARRLAAMGTQMANSPIVKTVIGDARASSDQRTLREMIADAGRESVESGDLILFSDGGGQVIFAEQRDRVAPEIGQLAPARGAAESQTQQNSFVMLGDRLFQLVLTPIVLHSASTEVNNTLGVIGTGAELNRDGAMDLKRRIHSDAVFFAGDRLHASSLLPEVEPRAAGAIAARDLSNAGASRPVELKVGGDLYLAFARQLTGFNGERIGQVVVMRSLAGAGQMFRAISNRLLLLWTLALATAWLLSYLIAGRITRPIESLARSARELGTGNYDLPVPPPPGGEIGQLAQAFNQMRSSLKQTQSQLLRNERLATIGQMASSIIHDLRNPLATISTAAEVMQRDGVPPPQRDELLRTQLRASHRMSGMLGEILEFSRGSYKLDRREQSLVSIVQRAAEEFAPQLARLDIELETQVPAGILVYADAERVERVLGNLLANAVQAMPQGGRVEIGATGSDGHVRIDVVDDGPGVPPEIRERLFEPFISHGKQGGTGLGLAIARGIIEAHDGRITLADSNGRGAHFVIELPTGQSANWPVGERNGWNGEESFTG